MCKWNAQLVSCKWNAQLVSLSHAVSIESVLAVYCIVLNFNV